MPIDHLHSWNLTPAEALGLQKELAAMVRPAPLSEPPRLVAGADVAYSKPHGLVFAVVVLMTYPGCEIVETVTAVREGTFPYVPGLLSFREGPVLLDAFERLRGSPDVVMFDGQGRAHPRRLGLACHLGLFLGIPSVGCAKSRLTGEYREPGRERGSSSPLTDGDEVIGAVVRTRTGVRPLFVSVGHLATIEDAVRLVLGACRGFRLPEPTRAAHNRVTLLKAERLSGGRVA